MSFENQKKPEIVPHAKCNRLIYVQKIKLTDKKKFERRYKKQS